MGASLSFCDTWACLVPHCLSHDSATLGGELPHPFLRPLIASHATHSKTDAPGPNTFITICPGPHIQLYGIPLPFQQFHVTLDITSLPGQAPR